MKAQIATVAVVNYGYNDGLSLPGERPDWIIGSLGDLAALPAMKRLANTEA